MTWRQKYNLPKGRRDMGDMDFTLAHELYERICIDHYVAKQYLKRFGNNDAVRSKKLACEIVAMELTVEHPKLIDVHFDFSAPQQIPEEADLTEQPVQLEQYLPAQQQLEAVGVI